MGVATTDTRERIIVPGPAGFHPPSAAQLGVSLPEPGQGLFYGLLEPKEEVVIEEMARKLGGKVALIEGPFEPEGGAYAEEPAHDHAHHDHGHHHHHHVRYHIHHVSS